MLAARGRPEPVLIFLAASLAGLFTQKLTYENGVLKMNYTGGDTCHKVYQRSTTIFFYCDRSTQTVSVLRVGTSPWLCCLLSENKPALTALCNLLAKPSSSV